MIQALQVDAQEWDSQIAERRLTLVNEDIEATKKQIQSLEKQKNILNQKYKDIEFTLDELRSNMDTIQTDNDEDDENGDDSEGDFFTLLSDLENEEAALRGELQSYKELQKSLAHDRRKYSSVNSKLKSDLNIDKQKLESLQDEIKKSDDELKDLQVQLDTRTTALNDLIQRCTDLQTEEIEISDELKRLGESMVTELAEAEKNQKILLSEAKKKEEDTTKLLARTQREYQKNVDKLNQDLSRQNSISFWRNDRALLTGKLKKAKTQLQTELQNAKSAQKRQDTLSMSMKKMFGENDPGDGTGIRAKEIVLAGIERLKSEMEYPDNDEEQLQIEMDYNNDLHNQLEMIESSLETFYKHRNETINSLNDELFECTQDGYLKLLQSELSELQSSLSRH